MDFGDTMLDDLQNFDLDEIQFSPCYSQPDSEKDAFPQKEKEFSPEDPRKTLLHTTDQALNQIELASEPSMFPVTVIGENFAQIIKPVETPPATESNNMDSWGSQIMDGEEVCLQLPETEASDDFNSLLQLTENDPDPPSSSNSDLKTVNPTNVFFTHQAVMQQGVKTEVIDASSSHFTLDRTSRHRRKSVQTSRNCQDSPMTFENEETMDLQTLTTQAKPEYKPFALMSINGTESRSRDRSASATSIADIGSPASVKPRSSNKNGEAKRKRKYECEDDTDPSVKNAKAAKMNRDKKKQQMQELQKKVGDLTSANEALLEKNNQIQADFLHYQQQKDLEVLDLQQRLQSEISKNAANSKQKVVMIDLIKKVVSVMDPPPQVIRVSERLSTTPMPNPEELDTIRNMQPVPQTTGTNTYLTFKGPHFD